jgi:hypothetical protein
MNKYFIFTYSAAVLNLQQASALKLQQTGISTGGGGSSFGGAFGTTTKCQETDMFGNCLDVVEECERDIFGNCIEEVEPVVEDEVADEEECLSTDIFGNCTKYAEPQVEEPEECQNKDIFGNCLDVVEEEPVVDECQNRDVFGNCLDVVEEEPVVDECQNRDIFGNCLDVVEEEPVVEPIVEPVVEPVVEPIVEPVVEPVVEPIVEPVVEPVVEPIVETVVEPVFEHQHEDHFTNVLSTATVDRSYKYESELMTFADAQANCEAWGGNLASIHDLEENAYILENAPHADADYWIGLANDASGYTTWSDGTPLDYSPESNFVEVEVEFAAYFINGAVAGW